MVQLSGYLLYIAFFLYLAATILFAVSVTGRKWRNKEGEMRGNRWAILGFLASIFASIFSIGYFITRWYVAGHAPVSNMYEYMTFFSIAIGLAFIILYAIYRSNYLGLFTMPVVMLLIAYASMFPGEISPLIPSLQSHWLMIHVITVALGQGILTIGMAAGLIYLLRTIDFTKSNLRSRSMEFIIFCVLSLIGFIVAGSLFNAVHYEAEFKYINEFETEATIIYKKPALIGPNQGELITEGAFSPFFNVPGNIRADDLNTVIWSILTGLILYILLRLILRKRISAAIQPLLKGVSPQFIDEISYRAIAIGFPVFTLGGLIFAMIWAEIAWSRFWGWDPKEVWALITFLFYAAYLHLRLSKGWHGERSAWLCVIGFGIIMFNLVFVNLVISGLHSYAL
ncbi:c-type cytochrome biogenesis protein CcsB [Bacillus sp. JCM 19034]|uniref:c-type cytochrome biogenesis protein CcsB n=1 Tax=Bacillus sp. JCM 19034 TaxID=1481928 RepID=UPI00078633DA|nr:c-type cytochrome biogenesis protein CcsB [Bacillus sp. JCM 19034]